MKIVDYDYSLLEQYHQNQDGSKLSNITIRKLSSKGIKDTSSNKILEAHVKMIRERSIPNIDFRNLGKISTLSNKNYVISPGNSGVS